VEQLDVETVVKASQVVSGEIELSRLIDTLMRIAIEHAGAERGLLMLAHDGELRVDAEATSNPHGVSVTLGSTAVTQEVLPVSVLRYVVRTKDSLILKTHPPKANLSPILTFSTIMRGRSCACRW